MDTLSPCNFTCTCISVVYNIIFIYLLYNVHVHVHVGFSINQDQFISKVIQPRPFTPFGELLHVHMSNEGKKYEIYKVHSTCILINTCT